MIKKTKIIATISDRNCDADFIKKLYEKGMDAVRINTAHQVPEQTLKIVENVRKISDKIPIIIDTKGPEIRVETPESEIVLEEGKEILLLGNPGKMSSSSCINLSYANFSDEIQENDTILIDDGAIELAVRSKENSGVICTIKNGGIIDSRKSVNVPGRRFNVPSLSQKDREYVFFAAEHDIDFIAHSFVRDENDVLQIQKILDEKKSDAKIIAKIENQEGVSNIEQILDCVYGVMVARGDLGVELDPSSIPHIQKKLIIKCKEKMKPVIVATQMLDSMIRNPRPTRAEVSDIANAVYDGADCLMLSGETANGKYPAESVSTMTSVIMESESRKEDFTSKELKLGNDLSIFLANAAVQAAAELSTKAVITDTTTGRTARYLSSFRGKDPIHALCYDKVVMRLLAISYGIFPDYIGVKESVGVFFNKKVKELLEKGDLCEDDKIVIIAGSFGPSHGPSFIEISEIKNIIGA